MLVYQAGDYDFRGCCGQHLHRHPSPEAVPWLANRRPSPRWWQPKIGDFFDGESWEIHMEYHMGP